MYDALIVANGEIPQFNQWQDISFGKLICTDGAAKALQDLSFQPDIIIGDMDSVVHHDQFMTIKDLQQHFPQSEIHLVQDQNSTDFEKALHFAQNQGWENVLCIGALGKSADHGLHNLLLLAQYHHPINLMLLHLFDNTRQWIFPIEGKARIHTQPNQKLSFFPLPNAILTTQGLQWELQHTGLQQMGASAVRNITRSKTIQIHCEGKCLCFLTSMSAPTIIYD